LLPDEAATLAFAGKLSRVLREGMVIYLCGDLGAGKTTLVRGLINELGYTGRVKSPICTAFRMMQNGMLPDFVTSLTEAIFVWWNGRRKHANCYRKPTLKFHLIYYPADDTSRFAPIHRQAGNV